MGDVGGGRELLEEAAFGIGVGSHAALFDYHIALLVELAGDDVGKAARFKPGPELEAILRHRPEEHGLVEAGFGIEALGPVALGHVGELVGDDEFVRFCLGVEEGLFQSCEFDGVAAHRLQVFGLVGVVGGLDLGQGDLLVRIVVSADLAGSLEGQVFEHVGQTALARGVVHVAGIDEGGVAEDRRLRPLADDERDTVGKDFGGDLLLETLEVLGLRGLRGCQSRHSQHQHRDNLPGP